MTKKLHLCSLYLLFILASSFTHISSAFADNIQRVRIDFTMPNGFVRHLLLGFTPDDAATDGVDYGYDALNMDTFPDDLNWMIENDRYLIQGVGTFNDNKKYPLGLFLENTGDIKIDLNSISNFETPINVYIYDAELNSYTQINNSSYAATITKGEYLDRFYLVFKDDSDSTNFAKSLSTDEYNLEDTKVSYLNNTKELYINTNETYTIKNIHVNNLLGQEIFYLANVNSKLIKIPLHTNQTKYGIVTIETNEGDYLSKKIAIN